MAWHLMEKMIEHSAAHATLLGKWWIAFMFVFRFIVVASIGDTVYSDEQDQFTCNTKQPGCKQVCYNMFAPISHIRFWAFQILATGAPSVIFVIFAMHRLASLPKKPEGDEANKETSTQTSWRYAHKSHGRTARKRNKLEGTTEEKSSKPSKGSSNGRNRRREYESTASLVYLPINDKTSLEKKTNRANLAVVRAYVLNVVFTTIIEAVCMFLQWFMYQWYVPEFYECIRYPCPKIVECYISRPMEKTIFIFFMFGIGAICLLLNVLELQYLGWKRLKRYCTYQDEEMFIQPSVVLGTYPEIMDAAIEYPIGDQAPPKKRKNVVPSAPPNERVINSDPKHAPPGYYIPHVMPPKEPYRSPESGFPPIRVAAASFTTSETDVTSDDNSASMSSMESLLMSNAKRMQK